ncbi:MAG: hypothetical protein AAB153_04715 [Pseudomonadota bacterium]
MSSPRRIGLILAGGRSRRGASRSGLRPRAWRRSISTNGVHGALDSTVRMSCLIGD